MLHMPESERAAKVNRRADQVIDGTLVLPTDWAWLRPLSPVDFLRTGRILGACGILLQRRDRRIEKVSWRREQLGDHSP